MFEKRISSNEEPRRATRYEQRAAKTLAAIRAKPTDITIGDFVRCNHCSHRAAALGRIKGRFHIYCVHCGERTPWLSKRDWARELWNMGIRE